MKKTLLLVCLGMFITNITFSQMSFTGNKLKKSAFDLTEKKANFTEDNSLTSKVVITDEDNDMMKKRRKKRGGRRGGGGDYSNSITIKPVFMIFGIFSLEYERKIADNMSLGLGLGYYTRSSGSSTFSGFQFVPEFRYYFEEAVEGWYASPYITYTIFTESYSTTIPELNASGVPTGKIITKDVSESLSFYGGGVVGGRKWVWGGFTLDAWVGFGYLGLSGSSNESLSVGILPVSGLALGFSF
ncbi:MAG: DUF3575 domain-containing protein [Bacteroidales bacterium]